MSKLQKTSMPRLGQVVQKVTTPIFRGRGFAQGRIVTEWEQIVGPQVAQYGLPERVTFPYKKKTRGTVHLVASGSGSMIFEHQSQMIIDKINTYFGYNAIEKLRYRIDYVQPDQKPVKKKLKSISEEDQQWLEDKLADCEDPELKARLQSFGEAMLRKG